MEEFIFIWSIENISYCWHQGLPRVKSPSFVAETLQSTVWTMSLNPMSKSTRLGSDSDRYLSFYIIRGKDNGPKDFLLHSELSIVSANHLPLFSVRPRSFETKAGCSLMRCHLSLRMLEYFLRKKDLYFHQDILTLRCRMWKPEGDRDQFGQCFCRTRLEVERILSVADMNPRTTRSKTIPIHSRYANKALLSISIFHEKDCLKIELHRRNTVKFNVSNFKISAVGRNRSLITYMDSWCNMPKEVTWTIPFSDTDNKASARNKLRITSEFVYTTGEQTDSVEKVSSCSYKFPECSTNNIISCIPSGKLSDCPSIYKDLWDLYSKKLLCDVKLKTQTTTFWVHKAVLCARSPVFLAMFTGEMMYCVQIQDLEDDSELMYCVQIQDLEDDTLEKFISFLYTDSFEESQWNAVIKLYYVANKYQVERLKFFCSSFLWSNMDDLNVCELLMLADKHCDRRLKYKAADYIVRNEERIFRSSTWKKISENEPLMFAKTKLFKYEEKTKMNFEEYNILSYPNAMDDFRSLYQGQEVSDIVIQTARAMFPAHKAMLCAGSSTLRIAITVSGESTDSLKMEDLEDDTVSRLLLFLYTDSLGDVKWEDVAKLYHAAIAYQIERLKVKCSCFFLENLEESNAAGLLKLADEHRDNRLKSLVEDFNSLFLQLPSFSELRGLSGTGPSFNEERGLSETRKTDPPKRMETRLSKRLRLENTC